MIHSSRTWPHRGECSSILRHNLKPHDQHQDSLTHRIGLVIKQQSMATIFLPLAAHYQVCGHQAVRRRLRQSVARLVRCHLVET